MATACWRSSTAGVTLRSRRGGLELTADFPALCAELGQQNVDAMILDGEIVAFGADGKPSFNAMQNRGTNGPVEPDRDAAVFFASTCCTSRGSICATRRTRPAPVPRAVPAAFAAGAARSRDRGWHRLARRGARDGFEGVIGKRKDSRYEPGKRSGAWLKIKATNSADFVIGGYTKGKGSRAPLGSVLVGTWERRQAAFASHVGSGFDDARCRYCKARLEQLQTKTSPFAEKPELHSPTTWVKPEARRRSEVPELDRRRKFARAGVPAAA